MRHHPLESLFAPRSIAVVGASEQPDSVGQVVLENLRASFRGELHAVNHARASVQGLPCAKSVGAIGRNVELVVIAVPAASVPAVLRDAGKAQVKAAVVMSSGFAEAGEVGAGLQAELLSIAHAQGIRLLGPNCLGLSRPSTGLHAVFSRAHTRPGKFGGSFENRTRILRISYRSVSILTRRILHDCNIRNLR